jgi:hypothetical protein
MIEGLCWVVLCVGCVCEVRSSVENSCDGKKRTLGENAGRARVPSEFESHLFGILMARRSGCRNQRTVDPSVLGCDICRLTSDPI